MVTFEEVLELTIYEKLAEVHAAIKQPVKDSVNPHFNSSFASLNECNRVVSDAVREVGECDYWQRAVYNPDARCWEMQTVFVADNQEIVLSSHPFLQDANPQRAASASTYARRYSMVSAFNLAAEDDDGNQAATNPSADMVAKAKRRMWESIKKYARMAELDPNDVLNDVMASDTWNESIEHYDMIAQQFEDMLNG